MRKGRGVHYVAVGVGSYGEAVRSARSLKEHMPEMHITIHTDQEDVSSVFDVVERVPSRVPGYEHLPLYPDSAFYNLMQAATIECFSSHKDGEYQVMVHLSQKETYRKMYLEKAFEDMVHVLRLRASELDISDEIIQSLEKQNE